MVLISSTSFLGTNIASWKSLIWPVKGISMIPCLSTIWNSMFWTVFILCVLIFCNFPNSSLWASLYSFNLRWNVNIVFSPSCISMLTAFNCVCKLISDIWLDEHYPTLTFISFSILYLLCLHIKPYMFSSTAFEIPMYKSRLSTDLRNSTQSFVRTFDFSCVTIARESSKRSVTEVILRILTFGRFLQENYH